MTMLFLDTSAYSLLEGGHAEAGRNVRVAKKLALPVIVVGELMYGFELGNRKAENLAKLAQFMQAPRIHVIPVNYETCDWYARLYASLRKKGRPIPVNDIWIAALCWQHGGTLLTADAHFLDLPQIMVRHLVI